MVAVPSRDSDNSSSQSTPEVHHRGVISSHPQGAGGGLDPTRPHSQALDNPLYANLEHVSMMCMDVYAICYFLLAHLAFLLLYAVPVYVSECLCCSLSNIGMIVLFCIISYVLNAGRLFWNKRSLV